MLIDWTFIWINFPRKLDFSFLLKGGRSLVKWNRKFFILVPLKPKGRIFHILKRGFFSTIFGKRSNLYEDSISVFHKLFPLSHFYLIIQWSFSQLHPYWDYLYKHVKTIYLLWIHVLSQYLPMTSFLFFCICFRETTGCNPSFSLFLVTDQ